MGHHFLEPVVTNILVLPESSKSRLGPVLVSSESSKRNF